MLKHSLIEKLLSRLPVFVRPNNPKNKPKVKKEPIFLHRSVSFLEVVKEDGEVVYVRQTHQYFNPDKQAKKGN